MESQERSAYFAHHIYCLIEGDPQESDDYNISQWNMILEDLEFAIKEGCKLVLKPLSAISDKDAIEVATLYGLRADSVPKDALIEMGISVAMNKPNDLPLNITDFLRSRGYALPFRQWSVEQLIEAGVLKLQENGK